MNMNCFEMDRHILCLGILCLIWISSTNAQLECPDGWIMGWSKCYKIFHGEDKRAYARARELCESYGSRLVTIKDQFENDLIGSKVEEVAGAGEMYYIGLSKETGDGCINCPDPKWSNGETASEYEGFWSDSEPNDDDGVCVFSHKNQEDYIYDRPYTWAYSSCLIQRSFVCERMAAPEGSYHCMSGGYINSAYKCDGNNDCYDGSDELDCPSSCRYYHTLPSGESASLGQLQYRDSWTCTWAIQTPPGTNAYVQFNDFHTEFQADFVTVYVGSISENQAKQVDRISGNLGARTYRSHNNMMFIRFTSDSSVGNTGTMRGFTGTYGALRVTTGSNVKLIAEDAHKSYSVTTSDLANTRTFLGQHDYVIEITTKNQYQFGSMITLEIENFQINEGDSVMFFDGDSPRYPLLATNCHDDDECTNYKVVYSTGKTLSVLLRTATTVSNNVALSFRYRQGCYYETSDLWGTLFTPGFPGKINYPNFVKCTWKINVDQPIALYFDPSSVLRDTAYTRTRNGDYLKMYDDGTMVSGSSPEGLSTADIAGKVFTPTSGKITLELDTSATRSSKGFLATWSIACPNPNYDDGNTIVSTPQPVWHYMSKMTVSCENGYAFQQEQTQTSDVPTFLTSVTVECGFKGIWKKYLQIPKCTPKYCGAVPSIPNGIIESATSVVYGGKATYKCNAGSISSTGSLEITCQADGTWSPRPSCVAATCPPGQISTSILNGNGELKTGDGTSIGTVYEFTCDSGFEFVGEPYVFCKEDGTWTQNNSPSCKRLTCLLPEIENVRYNGFNTPGQFINFESSLSVSCNVGYVFAENSPTSVTCNSDRTLSQLPECVDRNECEQPGICAGQCHNTIGSYYCTCDSGYTLSRFDQSSCQDINECLENTDNCDGNCDNTIGSYTCSCDLPYVLYTADMTSGFAIPSDAGERGDLPTDTYYIDHSCVLISCPAPQSTIPNGELLTKRVNHHYGDNIEYQCDIGYEPRNTVLTCGRDGTWIGSVPTCTAATCSETVPFVQNRPSFTPGPYSYNQQVTLECNVANQQFNRYRFCTYNKEQGRYEMQGSSYECGVVDCGQPKQEPGSTYGTVASTLFGSTFEFTCLNDRQGQTSDGSDSTVRCLAEGYWDFGNLQCTGQKCLDPGYPAGGEIVATSFADKSTVSFTCDRAGYSLSRNVNLTCQGENFFSNGESVPTCIDTDDPVIDGCPTAPIIVDKYTELRTRLPSLRASDNTGVKEFTVSPRNANSTLFVSGNLDVIYTAVDYAGNTATCEIQVQLSDESPPELTCPNVRIIELETEDAVHQYEKLEMNDVVSFADVGTVKAFSVTGEPNTITVSDLYRTFTYTVLVTDQSNNAASCKGQIFVRPKPCSELSFPTPLNAEKVCTSLPFPSNSLQCIITCQDSYTFEDSKSKTALCQNGAWDSETVTACVLDVTPPAVSCPLSQTVSNIARRGDTYEMDFNTLKNAVRSTDLNDLNEPVMSPESYTFTTNDLYRPKVIQASVTDSAGNRGLCNFQYTVIPPVCSELSLPVPQFGSVDCQSRSTGWDCTITCETGRILRNHGYTKTVSCNNNSPWSEDDIYPECIQDTKPPVITCPVSRSEKLYTGNEVRTITFASAAGYTHQESDYSGIKSVVFNPPSLQLSINLLNSAVSVNMIVTDNADIQASCSFQVLVEADVCSPLALPSPVNGQKTCQVTSNGYSCNVTCNTGFSFFGTRDSQIVTSCANGQKFTQYIPDCAADSPTRQKQYIAELTYSYVPQSDTVLNVPASCIEEYANNVAAVPSPTGDSILTTMAKRFISNCDSSYTPDLDKLTIEFLPSSTTGSVLSDGVNNRVVQMIYKYTIVYTGTMEEGLDIRYKCSGSFNNAIAESGNTYPLNQNIPGGNNCPELKWNFNAAVTDQQLYCLPPYFESLANPDECVLCPAGTESDGRTCSVCQEGYYRGTNDIGCVRCPTEYTTRYPGATGSTQCVQICTGGRVSDTGYSPCYFCPVGSYQVSATLCQPCGAGRTTNAVGAVSVDQCVDSTSINDEPCTRGTEDIGNNVCQVCPVGTYRSANSVGCVACPDTKTSTYVRGAISSTQCYGKCDSGFTSATGRAPCTPCPKGQYAVNETTCENCPAGFTTVTEGSTLCQDLTALRLKCPRGTSRDINDGQCVKCPLGRYSAAEEGSCTSCNSDESTFSTGAVSQTMCLRKCSPGFYSSTGMSPCTPCGIGKYSAIYGANQCTPCSINNDMITVTTTATSSTQCIAKCSEGFFSYNGYNVDNACRQCPRHHYQNVKGSTTCQQCNPSTSFSGIGGLVDVNQCVSSAGRCASITCANGGTCVFMDNEPVCQCLTGQYFGTNCAFTVNNCLSQPCYNGGVCSNTASGFTCNCDGTGATGTRCETITKLCDTSPTNPTCKNGGHCINRPNGFQCLCTQGFSGDTCSTQTDIDICQSEPCSSPGTRACIDVSRDSNMRRYCDCKPGYTGDTCSEDIDECASNPCINGGTCVNEVNRFQCNCPVGYSGLYCQNREDRCLSYNCRQYDRNATCVDAYDKDLQGCLCSPGYSYDGDGFAQYQIHRNSAPQNLEDYTPQTATTVEGCRERCTALRTSCARFAFDTINEKCYTWSSQISFITYSNVNIYTKILSYPDDDFYTPRYNLVTPSPSSRTDSESLTTLRDVYGLDICGGTEPLSVKCCPVGETCLDNDLPFGADCSNNQLNFPNADRDYSIQFKCSVSRVFHNNVCRVKNDYCGLDTCQNGGTCTSIFGGYRCSCLNGYTGKNCQTNINECTGNPCNNGGTCVDEIGRYSCQCTPEYGGLNCNDPKNFCLSQNCNGRGTCRNIPGVGYECLCSFGYEGDDCEAETDFCKSNPCQHGGTCNKRTGGYTCACVNGWQGQNCDAPVQKCSSLCQAECYNIFNNYYCKCEANSFGQNCENKPDPCGDYNKCQNGAACLYDGSMSCTCPTNYTGDGCHILRDYCGKDDPCENDGVCSVTDTGYQCACQPGYTGMRCQDEINECVSVTCPGNGQCFDAINKYYCRCPLKYTGTNCAKEYDRNYDMFFNHPQGYGFAWIPYPIQVKSADFLSISLWVRYSRNDGTGVYLTQFVGDKLEEAVKFLEFDEQGIRVYVQIGNDPYIQLTYNRLAKVNDGNWHLVTLLCDMKNGLVKHYLDTVWQEVVTADALVMPASNFSMYPVLGCEFDNVEHKCTEGVQGFSGYISQLNWYKRELTFEGDPNSPIVEEREGEIPKIFRLPQFIFDENMDDVILVWNEYEIESGVSRMTPSEAHGVLCNDLRRNPPCSSYSTSTLPSVSNCPEDIYVYSQDRIKAVTWTEPMFHNLGPQGQIIRPSRLPGSTFTWGVYRNTYVGIDGNNNKEYCHFTIYVNAGQCDNPIGPYMGSQNCNTDADRKGCEISCNSVDRIIDRAHPDLFTCGPSGWWNADKPFQQFRYPSCGLIKPTLKHNYYIRVNYRMTTLACNAAKTHVEQRSMEEFVKLNSIFVGDFCSPNACENLVIKVTCQALNVGKRRRRQTPSDSIMLLEIWLNSADARTTLDGENISAEEFLTYFILGARVLDFDTLPDLEFLPENFQIQATEVCPEGQVLRNGQCVECGPGNYFRYTDSSNTTAICDDCPLGSYQDESGTMKCKQCDSGFTTEMTGEYLQTSCKKSCPVGQYYNELIQDCSDCEVGYYQDEVGQFRCKGCPAGYTTKDAGSTSSSLCSVSCDSGYELNNEGGCDPCQIGQYRNALETRVCVSCPTGKITADFASRSVDDCNIIACSSGSYRDENSNTCKLCPENQYQPENWKTSCISCGDSSRWRTESEGTVSQSDCLYYCPSGYQVKQDPTYRCEICPIGTYKDNTLDIQGTCLPCTGNKRTEAEGSTKASDCTIYKCPVGYKPNVFNTDCVECPTGYYQDVEYSTDCKKCDDGYSTRFVASNSSGQCERYCPSGEEKINGICVPCKKGTYKNNDVDGLFSACKPCDAVYTTIGTGSDDISDCNIRTCQPGTKRNADDTGCDDCPIGTYQPDAYMRDCIACPTGTSTRTTKTTLQSACETYCQSGFEKTSTGCVGCERGYYKNNEDDGLFSPCNLCPIDYITADVNSVSINLCNVGNCSAGQYLKADKTCGLCEKGFYQSDKWQDSCIQCGIDKTTENLGSDELSDCILECRPGYEDVGGTCQECQRGFYKIENAASSCKPCPTGYTTDVRGASSADFCTIPACPAGEYLDRVTNPASPRCRLCAYDTYQDEIWQEQCKPCLNNRVTLMMGSDEEDDCVLDCASGLEYNAASGKCEFCDIGYYRNRDIRTQTQCQLCPLDKITRSEGGTDISDCNIANCTNPGEYRDTQTDTCKKCPVGTYSDEKWLTRCTTCPTGNSTKIEGATSINDCRSICPLGQYVSGSNACEDCPANTYRSDMSADTCTPCPNRLLTLGPGSDSVNDCSISPCNPGERYVLNDLECVKCRVGTYQPKAGQFQCSECPFTIKYTSREGAVSEDECKSPCNAGEQFVESTSSCQPCPTGTYQPAPFEYTCLQCPVGRKYTENTGSRRIEDCLSYCSASGANACSINATCTVSTTSSRGYTCACFNNYEDTGAETGQECVHKCDRGYCKNGAACSREGTVSCTCSKWYEGDRCDLRIKAEDLSDNTLDIVIPVSIAVGGLILFLIMLAVCCLCWRRSHPTPEAQYSEFQGDRVDKASVHSQNFMVPYASRPPSQLMMLAPGREVYYDNQLYTKDHSIIDGSVLDTAVYEA